MALTVGYMLTWRSYGTWVPGDERGYRQDGKSLSAHAGLARSSRERMVGNAVRFDAGAKKIVRNAIGQEAKRWGEEIEALAVFSNHVHVVVRYGGNPIDEFVSACKAAGRMALKGKGYERRVWAHGYDKQFCFDEESLRAKIDYVNGHGE